MKGGRHRGESRKIASDMVMQWPLTGGIARQDQAIAANIVNGKGEIADNMFEDILFPFLEREKQDIGIAQIFGTGIGTI